MNAEIENAGFLMALRERTLLNEKLFDRMPNLKLILQLIYGHPLTLDLNK